MAYCPFRNPDVFVTGHRSPKVVSWAAIKVDIKNRIASRFGHRGFTHSLLAVFSLLATFYLKVPESWFIPADALQGMVLGYLSHILADMLTPAGVPLLWPCRWLWASPILGSQKGQLTGMFYLYGIICLVGMDAPFIIFRNALSVGHRK